MGCTSPSPGLFPTAAALPEGRRKPDGVAVDPTSAPPAARSEARTEDGLVTLRAPLGLERATATVSDFFRKVVAEDTEGLASLLTQDALAFTGGSGGPGQMPSAQLWWEQRFRRMDYTKLSGEPIVNEAELQIFRQGDRAERAPHPSVRTDALGEEDVVVRVPILTPRIGQDRLLGDEAVIWLRRDGDRYKIYRILEEFQMP